MPTSLAQVARSGAHEFKQALDWFKYIEMYEVFQFTEPCAFRQETKTTVIGMRQKAAE
ncbi:hypothetical protein GCM10025859_13640 [Alicyclobacillus fastidiosus]|nr:hypothetical protein GCM10025859_13640 [Alicyclobacillus fastidiosus]